MKNLILILIFLLAFLSNNTVFAVANKTAYSEKQTIRTISKQKKISYLEKVFTKKIEKIEKSNGKFSEAIVTILQGIPAMIAITTIIYISSLPFSALGLSLGFAILAGITSILIVLFLLFFLIRTQNSRVFGC